MMRTVKRLFNRLFVYVVLASFTFVGLTESARATMIGTEQVVIASAAQKNREKVTAALNRPDVIAQLEGLGVDGSEAQARVAALTDAEVASIAGRIDNLPAAGESILGVLVFIFVLLLITDILGFTKIYPFTRSKR